MQMPTDDQVTRALECLLRSRDSAEGSANLRDILPIQGDNLEKMRAIWLAFVSSGRDLEARLAEWQEILLGIETRLIDWEDVLSGFLLDRGLRADDRYSDGEGK